MLEGKFVELAKPLAVMKRAPYHPRDETMADGDPGSPTVLQPPSWDIVAIVKRKMVFTKRPMPMVGRGATTVDPARKQ